jgi:hypothetical protein
MVPVMSFVQPTGTRSGAWPNPALKRTPRVRGFATAPGRRLA